MIRNDVVHKNPGERERETRRHTCRILRLSRYVTSSHRQQFLIFKKKLIGVGHAQTKHVYRIKTQMKIRFVIFVLEDS